MKLIVGLGNPGEEYRGTRHNLGAEILNHMAQRAGLVLRKKWRFRACVANVQIGGKALTLATPRSFMNLSGPVVAGLMRWLNCGPEDLLVVSDDINLEIGRIRLRTGGGSGGHKGVESVIASLGNEDFARLRVGVGQADESWVEHVLGKFSKEEAAAIESAMDRAIQAIEDVATMGIPRAMNRYNAAE
ncbi:MAG: aminoacyl-tRNA hydrolase [Candidatus Aureabacteria bacterium]|nr:aminoacyl-tRNA hydrolase [Candidatus Auribacterota bacterium]